MRISRRAVLRGAGAAASLAALGRVGTAAVGEAAGAERPLEEFGYEQVAVRGERQVAQRENVIAVLMGVNEDSLLKPFREMAGQPGPGVSLGGWYEWKPDYDFHHDDAGLAPGLTFGQWVSALARLYAGSKAAGGVENAGLRERAVRLNGLLGQTISQGYFAQTRWPAYSFDKLVGGLTDGHRLAADATAWATLDKVRAAAETSLPGHAVDREVQWRVGKDISWMWDESYTLPENLYLAAAAGAGERYSQMAMRYLDDKSYFEPLSRGVNVLADKHAYSYVNALCSAMQAYLVDGSVMHLEAAKRGFAMLEAQSFATGGWGPDEVLRKPGTDGLVKSLNATHNSFETPCGSYAHMKLTRYLLRATRDGHYGDSMERVMLNTVLGALPLQADGRSFYYSDYGVVAKKVYSVPRWPCCSGTLPQVVADYGINGYLREPDAVWVNLYQPSEVRWMEGGSDVALVQDGDYLARGEVRLRVTAARPVEFALRLRVPGWAGEGFAVRVNGRGVGVKAAKGFCSVERAWRTGDVVEVTVPMALRVEALPANGGVVHEDTVALLWGPLVLFALREAGDAGMLRVRRDDLMGTERSGALEWRVRTAGGVRRMVPFTDVGDVEYSTYLRV